MFKVCPMSCKRCSKQMRPKVNIFKTHMQEVYGGKSNTAYHPKPIIPVVKPSAGCMMLWGYIK